MRTPKILLIVLSGALIFFVGAITNWKQTQKTPTQATNLSLPVKKQGLPARLKIPQIGVNTTIESVGLTENGEMEVPSNAAVVGWFGLGSHPGEIGSAVIAGHVDDKEGKPGVFANLNKLKKGDVLYVEDDKWGSLTFVVREKRTFDPGYAEEVFSLNDRAHLNLITCFGPWNEAKKRYSKRLVVFADLMN